MVRQIRRWVPSAYWPHRIRAITIKRMNERWQDRIESDPLILRGKSCFRDTRTLFKEAFSQNFET